MIVRSTSFENFADIPLKHTGFGDDISPELTVADIPENTVSFAVVLDDLDVPLLEKFTHWIIWNISVADIPEGLPGGAVIQSPVFACQGSAWGKHRYRGPKQPFFIRKPHRYVFSVYALDCLLNISEKSRKKNLVCAMKGHILAEANITGVFKRP